MRLFGFFTGTISDEPKIITPNGQGKPFLALTVESPDSYSQYPNRLKAVVYDKDLSAVKTKVAKGMTIAVSGEVSSEAYISQKTNKPVGTLKMFVKAFETFGGSPAPAPAQETTTRQSAATAAPAAENDSVPF